MWQIITRRLSVIQARGLFVVTQIAAANLVTGRVTFAKVRGVTSSVCKELVFVRQSVCEQRVGCALVLQDPTGHTGWWGRGSRLVIMTSCCHLSADDFRWMQTNAADEHVRCCHGAACVHPPCLYFGKAVCSRFLLARRWGRADLDRF